MACPVALRRQGPFAPTGDPIGLILPKDDVHQAGVASSSGEISFRVKRCSIGVPKRSRASVRIVYRTRDCGRH